VIDGDAVVHEIIVPVPVVRVFDMFVDPRQLVRWIGISADLQARPGGCFRFEVMPGKFCEGQYVVAERPGRLLFTWGWADPSFGLPQAAHVSRSRSPGAEMTPAGHGCAWFTPAWQETSACCTTTDGHASWPAWTPWPRAKTRAPTQQSSRMSDSAPCTGTVTKQAI
jgi:uncharacterized protein YndB with AHSA1/START domain